MATIKFGDLKLVGKYSLLPGVISVKWTEAIMLDLIPPPPKKIIIFGWHIYTLEYGRLDGTWKWVTLKKDDECYPANPYVVPYHKLDQIFED